MKDLMTICGIYKITNTVTGQCYIGATESIGERISGHFFLLRKQKHPNKSFQRDFDQYKEEAFKFEILEEVPHLDDHALRLREIHWIKQHPLVYNRGSHRGNGSPSARFETNGVDLNALKKVLVDGKEYVTERELANHLDITPQAIRRHIKIGAFPNYIRTKTRNKGGWLIPVSDLKTYLDRRNQLRKIRLSRYWS